MTTTEERRPPAAPAPVPPPRAPEVVPGPAAPSAPATGADPWVECLQALAVSLVVTAQLLDWPPAALAPAFGVLLAGGGRLAAASLDRHASSRRFYRDRLPRLLLPLWALGAVAVPLMVARGWRVPADGGRLWTWALPVTDPPSSDAALPWVALLWFAVTSFWLLLLSPPLLWLFRRWPLRVAAVPATLTVLVTSGLLTTSGGGGDAVLEHVSTYACCWLLGCASWDGTLRRLGGGRVLLAGSALAGAGAWYGTAHGAWSAADPAGLPLTELLCSAGAVLVLLRLVPRGPGGPRPFPVRAVALLGRRSTTALLWSAFLVGVTPLVLERTRLDRVGPLPGEVAQQVTYGVLVLGAALLVGWLEHPGSGRLLRGVGRRKPSRTFVLEGNRVAEV